MYIYLDKNGAVKEIINDEALRQTSSNANAIHVYYEAYKENEISSVLATYELPDGTILDEAEVATETTSEEIPYSAERDLKYFRYYADYPFYVFDIADGALAQSGTVRLTLRMVSQTSESIRSMGLITFDVALSIVKADYGISVSQYNYLVKQWMNSAEGDYLPLDGSKPMQGDLNMASYFIKMGGLYLKNENGVLTFNGKELAKKADVVTLSGDNETITGDKIISDASFHFQGESTNTFVNVEDKGSEYRAFVYPTSIYVEEEGANTHAGLYVSESDTNAYLEVLKNGAKTTYEQDKITYGDYALGLPTKSGTLATLGDIPTNYATPTYVDTKVATRQPLSSNLTNFDDLLDNGTASGYLLLTNDGGQYRMEIDTPEGATYYNATGVIEFTLIANDTPYIATCSVPFVTRSKEYADHSIAPKTLAEIIANDGFNAFSGMFYNKNTLDFAGVIANGYVRTSDNAIMLNTYGSFGVIVIPGDGSDSDYVRDINVRIYYGNAI